MKTSKSRTTGRSSKSSVARNSQPRWHEVWGVLTLFFGFYVLIALLTYNHLDPSYFTQSKRLPLNYGGRIGANIAEGLIQLLGLSAFLTTALCVAAALRFFQKASKRLHFTNLFWHLIAIATCATLFALVLGSINYGGARVSSGGLLGSWIAKTLLHHLNLWGAVLSTLCLTLIALVFATPVSAANLLKTLTSVGLAGFVAASRILSRLISASRQYGYSLYEKRKTELLIEKKLKPQIPEPVIAAKTRREIKTEEPEKQTTLPSTELARTGLSLLDDSETRAPFEVVTPAVVKKAPKKPVKTSEPHANARPGTFSLPSLDFLNEAAATRNELDRNKLIENSKILETKLTDFGIDGSVVAVRPGPVITMYEFKPGPGVKISQIAALADDLSLALSAQSVRIVAPIPGKSVVGIEIPNDEREKVFLREILSTEEFQGSNQGIPLAIGKDISGAPVVADLARMPHLLIAGAPGAGKSVFINSLICSLLYKFTPNDMRLIMVDPKQLELNLYEDIPHLLLPVVDDPKKASTALKWATNEMERRYKIMAKTGVRNITGFNEKLDRDGETKLREVLCPQDSNGMPDPNSLSHLLDHDEKGQPRVDRMPFILVIIDEFADLMMVAPKDIETSVARLAQKARAAGIHLVIATQRPSVDVITGLIKANLPSRISFQVASKVDSRTILDSIGSEKLLGQGDMLFIPPGLSRLTRIHGAFVNEDEIGKLCKHWRDQAKPVYREEILLEPEESSADDSDGAGDELYGQAVTIVREMGQASASMLQRRLKVGYNRAARMVEAMEAQGIVGPADGARPREVLY
ncbi:MAG: DNA translocase FtsK 4TM domain-containing protein [Bdellovibrionota bacterium]